MDSVDGICVGSIGLEAALLCVADHFESSSGQGVVHSAELLKQTGRWQTRC